MVKGRVSARGMKPCPAPPFKVKMFSVWADRFHPSQFNDSVAFVDKATARRVSHEAMVSGGDAVCPNP
jgi:hypothetical protein